MSREKKMKRIQTEIKMTDKTIRRILWEKNILEDRVTATLTYSLIPALYLLAYILIKLYHSEELGTIWLDPLFLSYLVLSLTLALRSKKRAGELEGYYRNLKCWRRYWMKKRDDLLEEDPSLKDVKPGIHIRELAEISSYVIMVVVLVVMLWSYSANSKDTACCLTYVLFLTMLFILLYFLPTRHYEGQRCPYR